MNTQNRHFEGSYYCTIPMVIMDDEDLSSTAKLLYGRITNLARKSGYCYASNAYLAEVSKMSKSSVGKCIAQLLEKEYLIADYIKRHNADDIVERHLWINDTPYKHKMAKVNRCQASIDV
jgi:hypothetical protein